MLLLVGLTDPNLFGPIPAVQNRRQLYALLGSARQRTMMRPHVYPQYRNRDWDIIICFVSYCNLDYAEVVPLLKKNKSDLKLSELYRSYLRPSREMEVYDLVQIRIELNSEIQLIGKSVHGEYKMLELDFSETTINKFRQFALDRPTVNWKDHEIKNILSSWERSLIDLQGDLSDDFHFQTTTTISKHPFWSCLFGSLSNIDETREIIKTKSDTHKLIISYLKNIPQGKRRWGGRISFEAMRAITYQGEPKITRVPSGLPYSHAAIEIIKSLKNYTDSARSGDNLWDWISEQENLCLEFALVTIQEYEILRHWDQIDDCFENAIDRNSISFYPNHKFASDLELEHFIEFVRKDQGFLYSPNNINNAISEFNSRKS